MRHDAAVRALDPTTVGSTRAAAVSTIGSVFLRWYGIATLVLGGLTVAALAVAASARMAMAVRRLARMSQSQQVTVIEVRHQTLSRLRRVAAVTAVVTLGPGRRRG